MPSFVLRRIRPHWAWVVIVIVAMLGEAATGLAAPWALKIVLDSVLDGRPLPAALTVFVGADPDRFAILNLAVVATVAFAVLQGASSYLNMFYSANLGQWIAHDLRQTVYAHLMRLSMSYYDRQQVGPLISTITDDINAVQDFVSTALLKILLGILTVVGMLAVMLTLN